MVDENSRMTTQSAAEYHSKQVQWLKEAGADLIMAGTMTNPDEAAGLAEAAKQQNIPVSPADFCQSVELEPLYLFSLLCHSLWRLMENCRVAKR